MNGIKLNSKLNRKKADWHRKMAKVSLVEKIRILLQLQKQDLDLVRRHRSLKWYERPWPIIP